jgi:hypothetical protein
MSSRETEIIEEELEEVIDLKEQFKEEVFDKLKIALIDEKRLLKKFHDYCEEYNNFEYDEMGMNMEEGEDVLRLTNKIRDKILTTIEEKLLYIFENAEINTLTHIILFNLDAKEYQYKVIVEVFEDSFNLELQ